MSLGWLVMGGFLLGSAAPAEAGWSDRTARTDTIDYLASSSTTSHATADGHGGGMSPRVRSMLLSMLVPGLGHYVNGQTSWAAGFFTAEAAIWASFVGFQIQANGREDRYVEFAETWGGVQTASGTSSYFTNMGRFESYDEYRVATQGDEDAVEYSPEQQWDWPTTERRRRFRDLVGESEDSEQRAELMVGMALVNRALAVVHAARTSPNSRLAKFALFARPGERGEIVPMVTWSTRF